MVLHDSPEVKVTGVALGLTAYLAEPHFWAEKGAAQALGVFLQLAPRELLNWYTTSHLDEWRNVYDATPDWLVKNLSTDWTGRLRHLLSFDLVDDTDVPTVGFRYREYDPKREARASFIEVTLPQDYPSEALLEFAKALGGLGPFYSFIGGYAARWNEDEQLTAFWQHHHWAHRYLGLDIEEPPQMAWDAAEGLLGTNWLTGVGLPLAETASVDLAATKSKRWKNPISLISLDRGLLVQAGPEPDIGDLNSLAYPNALAEVAQHFAPVFSTAPFEFWGLFRKNGDTEAYRHRLVNLRWTKSKH